MADGPSYILLRELSQMGGVRGIGVDRVQSRQHFNHFFKAGPHRRSVGAIARDSSPSGAAPNTYATAKHANAKNVKAENAEAKMLMLTLRLELTLPAANAKKHCKRECYRRRSR